VIAPEEARVTATVAGFVLPVAIMIIRAFFSHEAPAPKEEQAPPEPGGVEFRASVSGVGAGLSEETLLRLAEDPAFGDVAKAVLDGRLIAEAVRYGWRPQSQSITPEPEKPNKRVRTRIRNLLSGWKRTIPKV